MARSVRNSKLPRLDPKTVRDEAALDDAVNEVVTGTPNEKAMSKRVLSLQNRLRRLVDDHAWHAFLRLEEVVNERTWAINIVVARWAFEEGRRKHSRAARRASHPR